MINYHNKRFKVLESSENSEVGNGLIFHYTQQKNILQCSYSSDSIIQGHLIGIVDDEGRIDMRYHQINNLNLLMTGQCQSTPEFNGCGKIILHEKWAWTSGDKSHGTSTLIEI